MKLRTNGTRISTTEYRSKVYTPKNLSIEAEICGNCPYDQCVEERGKASMPCKYFNEQMKLRKRSKK